ncbi:RagB/SusD family nutrient uptake outer membrane protein [Telluribacter sp. SYSU D00476]|uniref:RagB/SusD family nutrient uptake outer membrane protein n=1 Tax=Telluribacter sp. SYSU D00476 TaxID=2811430 RepID=UPI001FF5C5AA|nr:RagB/SusD family nutrient uptake outer membrane protein [Telluribacter sp. SYSU D00476]
MKKIKYCLLALVGMLLASCNEEFVTKQFKNGIVDENFYKTAKDAEQALTGVYDPISRKGVYRESIFVLGESSSDNIDEQTGDNGDYGFHFKAVSDYRWLPDNPFIRSRWYDCYAGIFRANTFLEKVPAINMDEALKKQYLAEATFLRALYYWNLVITFGDVPFMTKVLKPEEYRQLARTDKAEIYKQIEADLTSAIPNLPIAESNPIGRVTRGAALGFLGRVYLYQNKWQQAADASKQVVDLGRYNLVSDYISLFNGKAENSPEALMEFQSVSFAPGYWNAETKSSIAAMWSPVIGWSNWYTPSKEVTTIFPEGDQRRKSILVAGAQPADMIDVDGKGAKPFPSPPMRPTFFNNANVRKFLPEGRDINDVNNFDVNVPIIRFGEVLLNQAEALNELGRGADALVPLNQVRKRAGLQPVTETSQASLRDIIRLERRLELMFEGHRFFDLSRWGKAEEVLRKKGFVKGTHEYFPVPLSELSIMPNLTQYPK